MEKIIKILLLSKLCLAFLIFTFALPVWATDYYVKTGGNDNLDGLSDGTAWATIAKVTATATNGDTVYFRSQDTWTGQNTLLNAVAGVTYDGATYGSGTRATLQATSRTASYGIVQIYVSNVTFKGFKVDGNGLSIGGIYIGGTNPTPSGDISNITVDNCEVTNGITVDDPDPSYYYALLVGARGSHKTSNVTVTNNIVHDVGHEGIPVYPNWGGGGGNSVDTVLIRGNTIYNTGQVSSNRNKPIAIVNDSDNVTVEFNTIYNAHNIGVANYGPGYTGPDEYPDDFVIRYNLYYSPASGITQAFDTAGYFGFPHFYGTGEVYGNLFIDAGIGFGGLDYHSGSIKIYNNTIYMPTTSMYSIYMIGGCSNTSNIEVKNNIFYNVKYANIKDYYGVLTNHSNNLLYRSSGTLVTTSSKSYTAADITDWEATAQNTNPNFQGGSLPTGFTGTYGIDMVPNTNYFFITKGNALNNGANLGSPYNGCINGAGLETPITRSQSGAYDIGAYEDPGPQPPKGLRIQN